MRTDRGAHGNSKAGLAHRFPFRIQARRIMSAANNVTVDPLAPATPVDDPEIAEIIDLDTGEILDTKRFIADFRYGDLVAHRLQMREALRKRKPTHACAICGTPAYLVANLRKRFFFRHCDEDGSCPAITRTLTEAEIRARKYHGLRESEAHKRIKRLIERSLRADPSFHTETIQAEKYWRSESDPTKWRRPDVQASSAQRRFAFEAQLSTTFLDVVVLVGPLAGTSAHSFNVPTRSPRHIPKIFWRLPMRSKSAVTSSNCGVRTPAAGGSADAKKTARAFEPAIRLSCRRANGCLRWSFCSRKWAYRSGNS